MKNTINTRHANFILNIQKNIIIALYSSYVSTIFISKNTLKKQTSVLKPEIIIRIYEKNQYAKRVILNICHLYVSTLGSLLYY